MVALGTLGQARCTHVHGPKPHPPFFVGPCFGAGAHFEGGTIAWHTTTHASIPPPLPPLTPQFLATLSPIILKSRRARRP